MISKRKVGELQGEVVLITLQFQDFSTLLTSLSVYDDSCQHQAGKLLRLLCYIGTDCYIAVITAHHYLMSLSAVTDVERHNRRNHEALALASGLITQHSLPDTTHILPSTSHMVLTLPPICHVLEEKLLPSTEPAT